MKNRIVRFNKFGSPDVLQIFEEKLKIPDHDEVRIRIKAFGVNQGEVMYREGRYVSKPNFPSRLGSEGSGIIDLIGNNNIKFKVGDEVTIIDARGTWGSNNLTVGRNGLKINTGTADLTLSNNGQSITLVYIDATRGWAYKTNYTS